MNNKRVLVADDELHIREVISYKLQIAGLEVITAHDGSEALELAKSESPDLLIVDYQMPGLNGLEVCLGLGEEPRTSRIPAIMLTARGLDIEQAELEQARINVVIAKPFSPRKVLSCVKELLRQEEAEVGAENVRK